MVDAVDAVTTCSSFAPFPPPRLAAPERPREATVRELESALERTGAGDRRAFEHVYRLCSPRLFTICLRVLPRRPEAEDALQDSFLAIWERAARFDRARGSAMSWLSVITRNTAIDRRRLRVSPLTSGDHEIADPTPTAELDLIARDDRSRVLACLDRLDPVEAAFLRTAFLHDVTYADLARREQLPLGTVKSRIRRALLKLRDRLDRDDASARQAA